MFRKMHEDIHSQPSKKRTVTTSTYQQICLAIALPCNIVARTFVMNR